MSALSLIVLLLIGVQGVAADDNGDLKWIKIHGWLMWASMGFLMPLAILLIRSSKPFMGDEHSKPSTTRVCAMFYLHIILQIFAVGLATGGVAVLMIKTGVALDYTHQRLGLAICVLIWMQPFLGMVRPARGAQLRPFWFAIHWCFGTGALFLGVINIYIGIQIYELVTQSSIRALNISFSISIAIMCFLYLLQDRYLHMMTQGRRTQKPIPQSMSL